MKAGDEDELGTHTPLARVRRADVGKAYTSPIDAHAARRRRLRPSPARAVPRIIRLQVAGSGIASFSVVSLPITKARSKAFADRI